MHTNHRTDPLEGYNRAIFCFNSKVDDYALKPVATAYNHILPALVRKSILNFFNNIAEVPSFANDLLQGHLYWALNDFWRFVINSSVGLGGLFDVAAKMRMQPHYTDFGLTLARWGVVRAPYFVIPFLGPSTVRDAFGLVPYYFLSPYSLIPSLAVQVGLGALNILSRRAELLAFQDVIATAAFDPYVFQRNAYLQHRAQEVAAVRHTPWYGPGHYLNNANQATDGQSLVDKDTFDGR